MSKENPDAIQMDEEMTPEEHHGPWSAPKCHTGLPEQGSFLDVS